MYYSTNQFDCLALRPQVLDQPPPGRRRLALELEAVHSIHILNIHPVLDLLGPALVATKMATPQGEKLRMPTNLQADFAGGLLPWLHGRDRQSRSRRPGRRQTGLVQQVAVVVLVSVEQRYLPPEAAVEQVFGNVLVQSEDLREPLHRGLHGCPDCTGVLREACGHHRQVGDGLVFLAQLREEWVGGFRLRFGTSRRGWGRSLTPLIFGPWHIYMLLGGGGV